MFDWLTSRTPTPSTSRTEAPAPVDDAALEALAAVLRTFGTRSPALDDPAPSTVQRLAEGWADHLLLLRPPPEVERKDPVKSRDYGELRRYVSAWRKREVESVNNALGSLRGAVWALVRTLNRTLEDAAREDVAVDTQLRRLRTAAEQEDTQLLRAEVLAAADSISEALSERRRGVHVGAEDLTERIRALAAELQDARHQSRVDPLTRVANRGTLDEHLQNAVELGTIVETHTVLVLVDIDHFKSVNDRFGHPVGDDVLRRTAEILCRTFIRRGDVVARYGGEEFAVCLSTTTLRDARAPIERFLHALRETEFVAPSGPFRVTASAGASALVRGETRGSWVGRADTALYQAKSNGRNQACFSP